MRKKKTNSDNPHEAALTMLAASEWPNPRFAWNMDTVVVADLERKEKERN